MTKTTSYKISNMSLKEKIQQLIKKAETKSYIEKYVEDSDSVDRNTGNGDDLEKMGFKDGEIYCARESVLIIRELEEKLRRCQYALEFYSKSGNYSNSPQIDSRIDEDYGKLASITLEKLNIE